MSKRGTNIQEIKDQKAAILRDAKSLKAELTSRMTTENFLRRVNEINNTYGFQLINTAKTGFYKDAYLAARFAPCRGATHVWLDSMDPPDFWVEVDGESLSFEATEILRPRRLRDKELQWMMEENQVQYDAFENWLSVEENIKLLSDAVRKKSGDKYKQVHGLILYLNTGIISYGGSVLDGIEAVIERFRQEIHSSHYREVWVACSNVCERIR